MAEGNNIPADIKDFLAKLGDSFEQKLNDAGSTLQTASSGISRRLASKLQNEFAFQPPTPKPPQPDETVQAQEAGAGALPDILGHVRSIDDSLTKSGKDTQTHSKEVTKVSERTTDKQSTDISATKTSDKHSTKVTERVTDKQSTDVTAIQSVTASVSSSITKAGDKQESGLGKIIRDSITGLKTALQHFGVTSIDVKPATPEKADSNRGRDTERVRETVTTEKASGFFGQLFQNVKNNLVQHFPQQAEMLQGVFARRQQQAEDGKAEPASRPQSFLQMSLPRMPAQMFGSFDVSNTTSKSETNKTRNTTNTVTDVAKTMHKQLSEKLTSTFTRHGASTKELLPGSSERQQLGQSPDPVGAFASVLSKEHATDAIAGTFKGLGNLSRMLGPGGAFLGPVGAVGSALAETLGRIHEWSDQLHAGNMRLGNFSGSMARVQSEDEVREQLLNRDRGEARADSARALSEARARRQRDWLPVDNFLANAQNRIGEFLENGSTAFGRLFSGRNPFVYGESADVVQQQLSDSLIATNQARQWLDQNWSQVYARPPRFVSPETTYHGAGGEW